MFVFNQVLMTNEQILYEGKPVPGKGSKGIGGILFLLAFVALWLGLLIWSVITGTGDGANGINAKFILFLLVGLLFGGIGIYAFVYNVFLKKKAVADDLYCVTNLRVLKYETTKQKLVFGYLIKYDIIEVQNEKDGFGDLHMSIKIDENMPEEQQRHLLKEYLFNKKEDDMPTITFESIENPYHVMKIAKDAYIKLKTNQ